MYYHELVEKSDGWRVDLVDVRVEGGSVGRVLSNLRCALGVDGRRVSGASSELPGNLSYKVSDGVLYVHASGLVAASDWLRQLLASVDPFDVAVRRVDWCCDVALVPGLVDALKEACTSYVADRSGGFTAYFGRVSRRNRRFSRLYLWQPREGGDAVFLRVEHAVRPVSAAEVAAVTRAYLSGVVVGGCIGLNGSRAEAVLSEFGIAVPPKLVVGELSVSGDVVRCRSVRYHLKRVRSELEYIRGVSGVGTLIWYVNQMLVVYNDSSKEVLQ